MDQRQALAALGALAQDTRLEIVRHLVRAGGPVPAGGIGAALGVASSRLSFHLATLEQAGLVVAEKAGRQVLYRADHAALGGLIGYLLEDCCGGDARVRACC